MPDYKDLGLDQNMRALSSLSNSAYLTERDFKQYIDDRVRNVRRPGGLDFQAIKNTSLGYQAIVGKDNTGGAFTDIQDAVNYVGGIGGGNIFLRQGTYVVDNSILVSTDGIRIFGESREGVTIFVANGANIGTVFRFVSNDSSISNLTIDGNKNNVTSTNVLLSFGGMAAEVSGFTADGILMKNQKGTLGCSAEIKTFGIRGVFKDCVAVDGEGVGFVASEFQDEGFFLNCKAGTCLAGFQDDGGLAHFEQCISESCIDGFVNIGATKISLCKSLSSTRYGYYLNGAVLTASQSLSSGSYDAYLRNNVSVSNCDFFGTTPILINGSNNSLVGNNITSVNGAILIGTSTNNNVIGNIIRHSGTSNQADSAIFMLGTSARNIISGNVFNKTFSGAGSWAYGIREDSANDDYNIVTSNQIGVSGTAIGTQGANTVVANNIVT